MVSGSKFGITLRVHLDYDGSADHIRSRASNLWSRHPAGAAPFRPEIDQHWNAGALCYFVELLGIDFQRFVHGR
jgi:hypothetical protein